MHNVLVTCPPMLGQIEQLYEYAESKGLRLHPAEVTQVLSEPELINALPEFDGWIIGDDPATFDVFQAAQKGLLKAAVKWGIGIDNVDFDACQKLNIPITNTPNMFGQEVADIAIGYMIGLARQTFLIDRGVRSNQWLKPAGISLSGKCVGVVGYGDIGKQVTQRLSAFGMRAIVYDPNVTDIGEVEHASLATYPESIEQCDFLVFTCALNRHNFHMLNASVLSTCKMGVRVINVARGPLIDEHALVKAIESNQVHSAALDVFETEPLPMSSPLLDFEQCIFGSHNSSNTVDAVIRASHQAIDKLSEFLHE